MLVLEFAKKYKFKGRDVKVAHKVYGKKKLTEQEWFQKLKGEFNFQDDEKHRKVREAKQKKVKGKETK